MNVAIITGASSGLGVEFLKHTAEMYLNLDEIWLVARRKDRLDQLAKEYTTVKCVPVALDLSQDFAFAELENLLAQNNATVSLLINNAGFGKVGNVYDMDIASQTGMVDLNCKGLTGVTSACLKHMQKGSQILNVCSIASFAPNAGLNVYSATKAYVMSLTKGLNYELKSKGINCCCVCPGPMNTEFLSVANIAPGTSKTFDTLPYSDPSKVAKKALIASKNGRCVYTYGAFYKFFRFIAKVLPHSLVMKLCKVL